MRLYLMESQDASSDSAFKGILEAQNLPLSILPFPHNGHESVRSSLAAQESGIVFIPAQWQDLLCVKIIQEIIALPVLFETVIFGPAPNPSNLALAFNERAGAFLETPATSRSIKLTINRLLAGLADRAAAAHHLADLERRAAACAPTAQAMALRDQLLTRALLDLRAQRGPLIDGSARVLLVITSQVQEKRLATFLRNSGLEVERAVGIAGALAMVQSRNYAAVIADGMLQDGSAMDLFTRLRKTIKTGIPRFIVWTSSPERVVDFYRPESYIDDVIFKPSTDSGMESILLAVVAGLYQTADFTQT